MENVLYETLRPDQFSKRLSEHPVGYLPLGTLEWHGKQNVLGSDALQANGLFTRCAKRYGGIVFPPLWVGPDRIERTSDGALLIGMDSSEYTKPKQQLIGSCYWVSKGLFLQLLESIVSQAKRAGFACLIADGHGPSRKAWAEMAPTWEKQYDIILLSSLIDFNESNYLTQRDHAGKNETSAMMALHPELVDLSLLDSPFPLGVHGEDPRLSSSVYGEMLLETTVLSIGEKLEELGL